MALKDRGYPWGTRREPSRREEQEQLRKINSEQVTGNGIASGQVHGTSYLTLTKPPKSVSVKVMTQQEIDASQIVDVVAGNPTWDDAGAVRRMTYARTPDTLVQDEIYSCWCQNNLIDRDTNTHESGMYPMLVYFPDGSQPDIGDILAAYFNYENGRWEGVATSPQQQPTECCMDKVWICDGNSNDCCLYEAQTLKWDKDETNWCTAAPTTEMIWAYCPSQDVAKGDCDWGRLLSIAYDCDGDTRKVYLFGGTCCPAPICPDQSQILECTITKGSDCGGGSINFQLTWSETNPVTSVAAPGWYGEFECTGDKYIQIFEADIDYVGGPFGEVAWVKPNHITGVIEKIYKDDGGNMVEVPLANVAAINSVYGGCEMLDLGGPTYERESRDFKYQVYVTCGDGAYFPNLQGVINHMPTDAVAAAHGMSNQLFGDTESLDMNGHICTDGACDTFEHVFGGGSFTIPIKWGATVVGPAQMSPNADQVFCGCLDCFNTPSNQCGTLTTTGTCEQNKICVTWDAEYDPLTPGL